MQDAIAADAAALDGVEGDVETIRATGEWFNALEDAILVIGEPRLRAIGRLRGLGWSYDRFTAATGLSKTRVAELSKLARDQGLVRRPDDPA
jgi:hypothetical protein